MAKWMSESKGSQLAPAPKIWDTRWPLTMTSPASWIPHPTATTSLENQPPTLTTFSGRGSNSSLESDNPVPKCLPLDTVRRNRPQEVRICILAARAAAPNQLLEVKFLCAAFGWSLTGVFHIVLNHGWPGFPYLSFKILLWLDGGSKVSEAHLQKWKSTKRKRRVEFRKWTSIIG